MDLMEEIMALEERAKELGIEVTDDISQEELQTLITTKEKELENSDIEYLKKELEKYKTEAKTAFKKRDQFKEDREKLANKIKEMESNMKNMIPSDEKTRLEEELADLREFKAKQDKEEEEKELKNKTELERERLARDKDAQKFQEQVNAFKAQLENISQEFTKEKEKNKEEVQKLRLRSLKADIIEEAAKHDAYNPTQIFRLTKDDFTYDKDLDKFTYQKWDGGKLQDEMSVSEYISDFFSREENENLIKSKVNTSSFKTDKDKTQDKASIDELGGFNPKDPDIIKKAEFNSMEPERYIKVVLMKNKKLQERLSKAREK